MSIPNTHATSPVTVNPRPDGRVKASAKERYRVGRGVDGIVYETGDADPVVRAVKVAHRRDIHEGG